MYNLSYTMISGSVIQAFLLELGISAASVSFYTAATQIVQVIVMLLASGLMDKAKKPLKLYVFATFFQIFIHMVLLLTCNVKLSVNTAFVLIFVSSIFSFLFYGIHSILSYKIPYYIMDMNDYGKIMGKSGVTLGICGSLFSALLTWCVGRYEYFPAMTVFYAAGIVMLIFSGVVSLKYNVLDVAVKYEAQPKEKINLLRYKPFRTLCLPDFLRGFNTGIYLLAAVIGYELGILDLEKATLLTVLSQVGTVAGCYVYSKISKPEREGIIIMLASVLFFVFMPLAVIGKSATLFCVMYLVTKFVLTFVDYSTPTLVTQIVDYKCIGQYSAWRMLLHTGGVALGGVALTYMLSVFGGVITLVISAGCQLISGVTYYIYSRKDGMKSE